MKRYIIREGEGESAVYYMTTGTMLEYDARATKGDTQKEKGVKKVAAKFKEEEDSPHTVYPAVLVKDSSFSAVNTR